eukprot:gene2403-2438_t
MKRVSDYLWPLLGIFAVFFSLYKLYGELDGTSFSQIGISLGSIPLHRWLLAISGTLLAYIALAWYDRIALLHLGHKLGWMFISAVSFTTYALSHNIGASVFSGAVVRYRAYSTKGLTIAEIGLLVAFTAFTFLLGTMLLGGIVLTLEPQVVKHILHVPVLTLRIIGLGMIAFISAYLVGSALNLPPVDIKSRSLPPFTLGKFTFGPFTTPAIHLEYPHLSITLRQLAAGPLELLGAAAIIYFALPEVGNPGFFTVLGVFLASFSAALISNAPGGLGVLEFVFVKALPDIPKADVVAALLVWRLLYLIVPLLLAIVTVVLFERNRLAEHLHERHEHDHDQKH